MSKTARNLLILLTAINLVNYIDRSVVSAVLDPLGKGLSLDNEQLGSLTFVFLIVYMVAAPIFGVLADKYHRPRLVAAGVALWSLATAGAALVHSYHGLLFTRSLVGVGEAAYAVMGPALLADSFPEDERAAKFTWFYMALPIGYAVGYAVGGTLAEHFGWRSAFTVVGLPGLLFAGWMALQPDPVRGGFDTLKDTVKGEPFFQRLGAIFKNRIWVACTVSYVAYTFAMGSLSVWAPTLLVRRFEATLSQAGRSFGILVLITGFAGTFLGGLLTTKLQKRYPDAGLWISGLTLLAAVPLVMWSLRSGNLNLVYGLFFGALLLLFVNTSPVNALTVSCLPASVRATGTAVNVFFIHLLGDAISPTLIGMRTDALQKAGVDPGHALASGMLIVVPALVVSGIALWWARGWKPGHETA
ncbi:MAG TPA: MFS transporter [Holophagaceae bacterium]|nr:MFS transporter [Holophagaceae bacterium]